MAKKPLFLEEEKKKVTPLAETYTRMANGW
jgi:hypothetical protein